MRCPHRIPDGNRFFCKLDLEKACAVDKCLIFRDYVEKIKMRETCDYSYRCNRECGSKECISWRNGQVLMAARYKWG